MKDLRARLLVRGEDYDLEGGLIAYTEEARQRVETEVLGSAQSAATLTQAAAPLPSEGAAEGGDSSPTPVDTPEGLPGDELPRSEGVQSAVVVKAYAKNRRLLAVTIADTAMRVRVKNNQNFVKGMVIPVRHVNGDLYELARRCPRWRGRW